MVKSSTMEYNSIRGDIMPVIFHILVHRCRVTNSYWAECPQIQGCNTSGKTLREIGERMFEAVDLCLDDYPDNIDDYLLEFEVCDA